MDEPNRLITKDFQGNMSKEIQLSHCISAISMARSRPGTSWRRCWPSAPPGPGRRPWRWWLASPRWTQTPSGSILPPLSFGWGSKTRKMGSLLDGNTQMPRLCASPWSNIQKYQMVDTKWSSQIPFYYLLFPLFSLLKTSYIDHDQDMINALIKC